MYTFFVREHALVEHVYTRGAKELMLSYMICLPLAESLDLSFSILPRFRPCFLAAEILSREMAASLFLNSQNLVITIVDATIKICVHCAYLRRNVFGD